jgi:GT2 family glycosyltransferase
MGSIVVQCVVVLYRCSLEESRTLRSLALTCSQQKDLAQRIALLIYDNSPEPQLNPLGESICGVMEYRHPGENGGLSAAYSQALSMARDSGIEWLLLLDQDTSLDADFLPAMMAAITSPMPAEICAIVPKVAQEGRVLSPQFLTRFRRHDLPTGFAGVHRKPIAALNSGACLRVKAVTAVGGFPREYWLDYLDHIMFYRLQAAGGRVCVVNVELQHRLSFQNMEKEMSINRYRSLLAAEWSYIRESRADGGPWAHRLRLLRRALGQALKHNNKDYAKLSFAAAIGAPVILGPRSKRQL